MFRDMTTAELRHVERSNSCPACSGALLTGPEGGLCVNVMCEDCKRKWNLCFAFGGGLFTGQLIEGDDYERIIEEGPRIRLRGEVKAERRPWWKRLLWLGGS